MLQERSGLLSSLIFQNEAKFQAFETLFLLAGASVGLFQ